MGVVHDGWDPLIGRRVAIKTIQLSNDDPDISARFRREAQASGRLHHPLVVTVFDYGEADGNAFLVMEFVDGPTLSKVLKQRHPLPLDEVLRLMDDVLTAVGYCHAAGVIHRDIKPGNIMVTRAGRAKLTDFGIARVDGGVLTQTGMLAGSAAYMSPEQFTGERVDERSDLWACGVLLFVMLTGKHPFAGSSFTETMKKIIDTEPPALSSWRALPPAFDTIVRRALAKNPAERFQSASRFAAALHTLDLSVDRGTTVASPIRP